MPATPRSQPAITWPAPSGNSNGSLRLHDESNSLPVECATPTYCTETRVPGVASGPSPTVMSVISRSVGAAPAGTSTVGLDSVIPVIVDHVRWPFGRHRHKGTRAG